MKVLILSTSDIEGGAARAAYRLHQGLCATGVSSTMLVRARHSTDASVVAEKSILTCPYDNTLIVNQRSFLPNGSRMRSHEEVARLIRRLLTYIGLEMDF